MVVLATNTCTSFAQTCPNAEDHQSSVVVDSVAALRTAITDAEVNGQEDRIYLQPSTYSVDEPLIYLDRGAGEGLFIGSCTDQIAVLRSAGTNPIFRAYKGADPFPCFGLCQQIYSEPYPLLRFHGLRFENGQVNRSYDYNAAGIGATGFDVEVRQSQFINLRGDAVSSGINVQVYDSRFEDITNGFAVWARLGSLHVSRSIFNNNRSGLKASPGVSGQPSYPVHIEDSSFQGHYGTGSSASNGAVDVRIDGDGVSESRLTILRATFTDNPRTPVVSYVATNIITDSAFIRNTGGMFGPYPPKDTPFCLEHDWAPCSNGGAVSIGNFFHTSASTTIDNSHFIQNAAPDYGGAINFEGVRNCENTFSREGAPCDPNEQWASNPDINLTLRNSYFEGNRAHRGAAIALARRAQAKMFQRGNLLIVDSEFKANMGVANPDVVEGDGPARAGPSYSTTIVNDPPEDGMPTSVIDVGGKLMFSGLLMSGNSGDFITRSRSSSVFEVARPNPPDAARFGAFGGVVTAVFPVEASAPPLVTEYELRCVSDGLSYVTSGTSSPLSLGGLNPERAYTCELVASNAVGQSSPVTSSALIPESPSNGLPVWLLYEASKRR